MKMGIIYFKTITLTPPILVGTPANRGTGSSIESFNQPPGIGLRSVFALKMLEATPRLRQFAVREERPIWVADRELPG